jgi:branched-chain amino acid transport system permease protein
MMTQVVVSLIGGITLGATYALIALGIVLAYRATATFNFAQGELMLLPAYIVGAWQAHHDASLGIAVVAGLAIVAGIGAGFYVLVLQRTTGLHHFMGIIATLGLAAVLDGVMLLIFGSPEYTIHASFLPQGVVTIGGARFSATTLTLTACTLILSICIAAALRFTNTGRRLRAAGQDPILASQGGINVRRYYTWSWALAAVLAGLAGVVYGTTNVVDFSLTNVALVAFPAIIIGGLDSIEGAVIGGLMIGIFQGFVATYLGSQLLDVLTYALLLVVMLTFPRGLFGTKQVMRV